METWVLQFRDGPEDHPEDHIVESMWSFAITPANSTKKHLFYAKRGEGQAYSIYNKGSELPLPPTSIEAMIGTVAVMLPIGPVEYGADAYREKMRSAY